MKVKTNENIEIKKEDETLAENDANNNEMQNAENVQGNSSAAYKTFKSRVDNFFKISERKSSFKQEFIGGLVNFLVLSYTLIVIPGLFSGVGGEALWKALFVATILSSIIATLSMALYANLPVVLAPGIGLCSYGVQLIETGQYSFAQAITICFIAGIIFVLFTVTGLRSKIVKAVPNCIKLAIPAGVGLFILGIGLNSANSGILDLLNGTASSYAPVVAIVSLIIMIVLQIKNTKGGIFIGILGGTVLDFIIKAIQGINPFSPLTTNAWLPPFGDLAENALFNFDFAGLVGSNVLSSVISVVLVVFAVLLIDIFDTIGTLYGTAQKGNLIDKNGEVVNMNKAMMVDGCSTIASSCLGLPSTTCYVESSAGIASGARTGFSGIVTSMFFALTLFLSPIVMLVPIYATAPALILVGILMFDSVVKIDFKDLSTSIPAILTIIIMPL
ncbi:MAG: NCS2 family permease, partial [Clostridia bacterium]|nr:NCS2 family permease [Clostridia bacterium]